MRRSGTIISTSTSAVGILVGTRRRTSASTTNTIAASNLLCILEPTWSGLTSTFYCSFCSLVVPLLCLLCCHSYLSSERQNMKSFCIHSVSFFLCLFNSVLIMFVSAERFAWSMLADKITESLDSFTFVWLIVPFLCMISFWFFSFSILFYRESVQLMSYSWCQIILLEL